MGDREITEILNKACEGDDSAVNRLLPLVYGELRKLAEHHLKQERPDHTLQATALVHEAYIRLIDQQDARWQSRAHFFAVAAQAIRRILVDHARTHGRMKRGGGRERITLHEASVLTKDRDVDLIALDEAIHELAKLNGRQARIVELRFFGGLPRQEIAQVVGVSPRTIDDDWSMARSWLKRQLTKGNDR